MCLQALVLRENGFECNEAVIYFQKTRQRVKINIDDELIKTVERLVFAARRVAEQSSAPAPLVNSPKCPKCSLSPICLPDETNRCRAFDEKQKTKSEVRLPATPRDDQRPLYLNKQGLYVGKSGEVLHVKDAGHVVQEVRLREINQVNLFGNIQVSTQAMQTLLELDIPLVMFSQHGYFHGMLQGTGLKNIQLRREQFRLADSPERCLSLAKQLVRGKILNQRVLLMRNHVSPNAEAISELKRQSRLLERTSSLESLLGVEGNAARIYFQQFSGMLKPGDTPIDPCNESGKPPRFAFDFRGRNRRPPRDPVNAMLSLCYTLLAKDFTITASSVGLDPYLGFFHQVRPGRPALALDLMEPFRALIADSTVISAINNRMVYPEHFIPAGNGVTMTEPGRKAIFRAYEQRMDQLVTHPLFDYRVTYRRLLEIQTRLLARLICGEIATYPVFVTR
jgi:CRISPR-associated protein Cas1